MNNSGFFVFDFKLKTLILLMFLCSILAFNLRAESLLWDRAVLSLLIGWIGLTPGLVYLATPAKQRSPFPLMPLVGLFYSIFFGLITFAGAHLRINEIWSVDQKTNSPMIMFYGNSYIDQVSIEAQLLVIFGIILMFGFWLIIKWLLSSNIPKFSLPNQFSVWRLKILIWGLVISNLLYVYSPSIQSLPSVGQFLQPAGFLGFALMLGLFYKQKLDFWQFVAYFCFALPLWSLGILVSGFFSPLVFLVGLWLAVRLHFLGKISWAWILVLPTLLVLAYPIMSSFRGLSWGQLPNSSFMQKLSLIYYSVSEYSIGRIEFVKGSSFPSLKYTQRTHDSQKRSSSLPAFEIVTDAGKDMGGKYLGFFYERSTGIVRRTGHIFSLSHVVNETPKRVPYWKGETYKPMFTNWIPRIFWENKPKEIAGNLFGLRYSILDASDKNDKFTSINIPWITEMFVNFGRVGVILGMSMVGLFLGLMECIFNKANVSYLEYGVGATILLPLTTPESNFTLMTGTLLPLIICFWAYFFVGLRLARK